MINNSVINGAAINASASAGGPVYETGTVSVEIEQSVRAVGVVSVGVVQNVSATGSVSVEVLQIVADQSAAVGTTVPTVSVPQTLPPVGTGGVGATATGGTYTTDVQTDPVTGQITSITTTDPVTSTVVYSVTVDPQTGDVTETGTPVYTGGGSSAVPGITPGTSGVGTSGSGQAYPVDAAWSVILTIGGSTYSDLVAGAISVDAEEGASRVASFTLQFITSSTLIDFYSQPVLITYNSETGNGVIFNGFVDSVSYNAETGQASVTCSDRLKDAVDKLTNAEIDAVCGGSFHDAVFGDAATGYAYSQQVMRGVRGSLDMSPARQMRVTDWAINTGWAFDDDSVFWGSFSCDYGSPEGAKNVVTIELSHRYELLRERTCRYHWESSYNFTQYLIDNYRFPNYQMIGDAIDATDWAVIEFGAKFWPGPGTYSGIAWLGDKVYKGVTETAFIIGKRWAQQITEKSIITVKNAESISRIGERPSTLSVSLDVESDTTTWESGLVTDVDIEAIGPQVGSRVNPEVVARTPNNPLGIFFPDFAGFNQYLGENYESLANYTDLNAARLVAEQVAKTDIIGSHRSGRASFRAPLNPAVDVNSAALVETTGGAASGKIGRVEYVMDTQTGLAAMDITLFLFTGAGGGTNSDSEEILAVDESLYPEDGGSYDITIGNTIAAEQPDSTVSTFWQESPDDYDTPMAFQVAVTGAGETTTGNYELERADDAQEVFVSQPNNEVFVGYDFT